MPLNRGKQKIWGIAAGIVIVAVILSFMFISDAPTDTELEQKKIPGSGETPYEALSTESAGVVTGVINKQVPIDYQEKDAALKAMMEDRKKNLGIQKSLDMIVKSDENFTIGNTTVSMQKIIQKAFSGRGKIFQEEIGEYGSARPGKIKEYGIYVVQASDNIWNIHFSILKDYYGARGIRLEELSDEPGTSGMSSGVGKILKFSETMVTIYNMIEEKVTQDIDIIDPLSKIVVYNMDALFSLLDEINFNNVDRLQFDGKNIWIPAQKR